MGDFVGTGKHLTPTELRLWTSFLDMSRILESELETQLNEEFAMTHREYEILVRIDGHGGQMRMSVLARQIEASPALVSQTVNRLVERGWLERRASPDDRRGVEAVLTSEGRSNLAIASGPHAMLVRRLLIEPLDPNLLDDLAASIGAAADHLRSHRAGEGCDDPACPVR